MSRLVAKSKTVVLLVVPVEDREGGGINSGSGLTMACCHRNGVLWRVWCAAFASGSNSGGVGEFVGYCVVRVSAMQCSSI